MADTRAEIEIMKIEERVIRNKDLRPCSEFSRVCADLYTLCECGWDRDHHGN